MFGTTAVLLVTSPAALRPAREILDAGLAAVDLACSRFRPDSELSALNRADGAGLSVSELFAELIEAALRAARLTGGAVDPTCGRPLASLGYDRDFAEVLGASAGQHGTGQVAAGKSGPPGPVPGWGGPVPGWRCVRLDRRRRRVRLDGGAQLDLGATAKAWAADRYADDVAGRLGCGVLVSLGGDIAVAGQAPPDGWRVRVTDDHAAPPEAAGQTVAITSGGLATSSTTVRSWQRAGQPVHHIIDPATGGPARVCWRTVTVAAGTCLDANTASTAAIVRGETARRWLAEAGLPARLVRPDGSAETTPGWPAETPSGGTA